MKRNMLLSLFLMAFITTSFGTTFSINVDASQYPSQYSSNLGIVIAKSTNNTSPMGSVAIDIQPLSKFATRPSQTLLILDTKDFRGYPYLLFSSKQGGSIVLKDYCIIDKIMPEQTILLTITYNGTPYPVYKVLCQ